MGGEARVEGERERGWKEGAAAEGEIPLLPSNLKTDPVSRIILRCSEKLKDVLHLK